MFSLNNALKFCLRSLTCLKLIALLAYCERQSVIYREWKINNFISIYKKIVEINFETFAETKNVSMKDCDKIIERVFSLFINPVKSFTLLRLMVNKI